MEWFKDENLEGIKFKNMLVLGDWKLNFTRLRLIVVEMWSSYCLLISHRSYNHGIKYYLGHVNLGALVFSCPARSFIIVIMFKRVQGHLFNL